MPVQTSHPGVYVQEVPSGVRTIVGVSTSITAFVGPAKRGPINRPVNIFNFSEFETIFGGLDASSEMSYGVRQFFNNGGSRAIIVRVADSATWASRTLLDANEEPSLTVTALDAGNEGMNVEVRVDHQTEVADSNFNLTIRYTPTDNPGNTQIETYPNLSMNSAHPRYVLDVVNGTSRIIETTRNANVDDAGAGTARSGIMEDVNTTLDSLDDTHNRFRLSINGALPVEVILNLPADTVGATPAERLNTLCEAVTTNVHNQANGNPALLNFSCEPNDDDNGIVMTSGEAGENSRVEVLRGQTNDAAARLLLTIASGGRRLDSVAPFRPVEIPARAVLRSGDITQGVLGEDGAFNVSLDGQIPQTINIFASDLGGGDFDAEMAILAGRIQEAVRNLRPALQSYGEFTCNVAPGTAGTDRRLHLFTGSRGTGASIVISNAAGNTMAGNLNLLDGINGAVSEFPINRMLENGSEEPITEENAYANFIGSRAEREGIYALESVDLFNILCVPGIYNPGIIADSEAYCRERRAFLIVDANPQTISTPTEMATAITGGAFPNSDHAAVYFPQINIADPLRNGRLRASAPSGTIAGLYARIDANRGVWKAPAGTEANLIGVQGLSYTLTDRENGMLNPLGANCLRVFPSYNAVSWGARTLNGADQSASEYKYIPIRRTALFIEESLYRGLQWAVFEPNDEPLWAQIRLNVGAFMHNLFRQGAFQGQKKQDAYFVKCDSETTTQNDINLGRVNIWVGFAPLKPAEFVVLYLQQIAGNIQT